MFTNMPIVDSERSPYGDTASPPRCGTVSPLDPALFSSVEEFAKELVAKRRSAKYSPLDVANWLSNVSKETEEHIAKARSKISNSNNPSFRRLETDVLAQAAIGRFFADQFRSAVAYECYGITGERSALTAAIARYRRAREAWNEAIGVTQGTYVDDITFGASSFLRGSWADRAGKIDLDISDMEEKWAKGKPLDLGELNLDWEKAIQPTARPSLSLEARSRIQHHPPQGFRPGEPVPIEIMSGENSERGSFYLHYRRANQADEWQVEEMHYEDGIFLSGIPAEYSKSPYPLIYYFELRDSSGRAWLFPGFNADLSNQPYYVIQQAVSESTETPDAD